MNQGTRLARDSLFLGVGHSRKLRRRFKELSPVIPGNEVVVGVNGIFVTPYAMSWFCLPLNFLKASNQVILKNMDVARPSVQVSCICRLRLRPELHVKNSPGKGVMVLRSHMCKLRGEL